MNAQEVFFSDMTKVLSYKKTLYWKEKKDLWFDIIAFYKPLSLQRLSKEEYEVFIGFLLLIYEDMFFQNDEIRTVQEQSMATLLSEHFVYFYRGT